jgi:hypothetical protein
MFCDRIKNPLLEMKNKTPGHRPGVDMPKRGPYELCRYAKMDRPAFRGFGMMRMMVDVVQGVHVEWQYTNGRGIWQVLGRNANDANWRIAPIIHTNLRNSFIRPIRVCVSG